ncbi:MAG: Asp-tRNA(Asn)/Glu-tRNA(Gln) amidotransferase subunit GatC [Oscillospiraceae bacterium]|nr:Asp-tRNA(Asn)/Glu-tRNA(Gln) amidotransferase subunit GatC [Oscillospiraceae bacterium]
MNRHLAEKIADLANLPLNQKEKERLISEFNIVLSVINELFSIDTKGVKPTYQVNNLQNVWRDDVINKTTQFTQEQALFNAPKTHNGYFVADRITNET